MKVVLDEGAYMPEKAHEEDAGYDLRAKEGEAITLFPGEVAVVNTGVHIAIPKGYVGLLCNKSGLSCKKGIETVLGVVDAGFNGHIDVKIRNTSNAVYKIEGGNKITQLVITALNMEPLELVDKLDDTERGANGFGSTGI